MDVCALGGAPKFCQVPRQPGGVSACLVRQEPASLPVNTGCPRVHALCRLLGVWGSPRGDTDPGGLRPSSLTVAISARDRDLVPSSLLAPM